MKYFLIPAVTLSLACFCIAFFSAQPKSEAETTDASESAATPAKVNQPKAPEDITASELADLLDVSRAVITLPGTADDLYDDIGLIVEYGDRSPTKNYGSYGPVPGGTMVTVLLQDKGEKLKYSLRVYGAIPRPGLNVDKSYGGISQTIDDPFVDHGNLMRVSDDRDYNENHYLIKCSTDPNAALQSNTALTAKEIGLRLSATKLESEPLPE